MLRGASVCKCASGVQEATHSPSCFVRGALHVCGGGLHTLCALWCRILTVGGWGGGWGWGAPGGGGGTLNIRLFGNFSGFLPYPGPSRPPAAGPPPPAPRPRPLPHRTGHTKVCTPHHKVQPPRPTTKIGSPSREPVHPRKATKI